MGRDCLIVTPKGGDPVIRLLRIKPGTVNKTNQIQYMMSARYNTIVLLCLNIFFNIQSFQIQTKVKALKQPSDVLLNTFTHSKCALVMMASFINTLLCFADMANSNHIHVPMEEENPLNTVPGSGDVQNNGDCFGQEAATFRNGKHHRTLAICSIICGISCIGIKALINSVKVLVCLSISSAILGLFLNLPDKMSKTEVAPVCAGLNCSKWTV